MDENKTTDLTAASSTPTPTLGRNEPCHCGSGKKYKRCHGVSAAPKLGTPKNASFGAMDPSATGGMGGFDPSQMDPHMMKQVGNALKRLPPAQMQKLQSLMQRAMAGQDVAKESADFERMLPPDLMQMLQSMNPMAQAASAATMQADAAASIESVDEAKKIIEKAMRDGNLSKEEGARLLSGEAAQESGKKGFLKSLFGKK